MSRLARIHLAVALAGGILLLPALHADELGAAKGVLERTLGQKMATSIDLRLAPPGDSYSYVAEGGKLHVQGGSSVAICRGVYDYLRAHNLGTVGWAGPRLKLPASWPDAPLTKGASPFKIRHCYNAVTPGYTTPYWDWKRWEQELDWLAMHGYNMIMAPVATEAIASRVWKGMGLTDAEIADFDNGPALLPWIRMGCVQNVSGDLTESWHHDQIALQKRLLGRMKELGIEPVVQGFAGFVPKGMKRLHPEATYHETLWNGGFSPAQRPVVMLPDTPLWSDIMKRFIVEWKKEFGEARYWLVDSFNELQLPKTAESPAQMLARYGQTTFNAIRSADPDAVWVLQGWMFNYQRDIWNKDTVKALVESVPANDLLVLDYANDYDPNWDDFSAFHGRSWVMGYVPNMGGKTAYCGRMGFYASQVAKTLNNANKGNLLGFTISGEGLENNEAIYELMSDTAWSSKEVNLDTWLPSYVANRYGSKSPELAQAWSELRHSVYSSFTPHPSYGWQQMQLSNGSVYRSERYISAVRLFLSQARHMEAVANYHDDAVEMAALVLGIRADEWFVLARDAHGEGDAQLFKKAVDEGCTLLLKADQLLESHPYLRLGSWLDFARKHDGSAQEKDDWERDARQVITIWGPPVNDYACRVWSGLIRDFYVPRMRALTDAMAKGQPFHRGPWEEKWASSIGISKIKPLEHPAVQAAAWVEEAFSTPIPKTAATSEAGVVLGTWDPSRVTTDWKEVEWPLTTEQLKSLAAVRFVFTGGNHRLDIQEVAIVADGKVVASDRHDGSAGDKHVMNLYKLDLPKNIQANNTCVLRAKVRSLVGAVSNGKIIAISREPEK